MKHQWFQENWGSKGSKSAAEQAWIPQVKAQVRAMWTSEYEDTISNNTTYTTPTSKSGDKNAVRLRMLNAKRLKLSLSSTLLQPDAFDTYLQEDPIDWPVEKGVFDVIGY